MEDELNCSICLYKFGSIKKANPRTLHCGHTFCTSCLIKIMENGGAHCPECRVSLQYRTAYQIPVSYTLLRIADAHSAKVKKGKLSNCDKNRLKDCIKDMKYAKNNYRAVTEISDTLKSEMKDKLFELEKDYVGFDNLFIKGEHWPSMLQRLSDQNNQTRGNSNDQRINRKEIDNATQWLKDINLQTLNLALNSSKPVWAVDMKDEKTKRFARISRGEKEVLLHALQNDCPATCRKDDIFISYSDVRRYAHSTAPTTFLKFSWQNSGGMIEIDLKEDNERAEQFAILCSGETGKSYAKSKLLKVTDQGKRGKTVWGGDYEHNDGTGGRSILPNVNNTFVYSDQLRGVITSDFRNSAKRTAQFGICLKDHKQYKFLGVFGEVTSGLQVLDAASAHDNIRDVIVEDCGIVIPIKIKKYL